MLMSNISRSRVLAILICAVLASSQASGKIIYVDANAIGANNGSSWPDAYRCLQDALADANSSEKPVEIQVAQGIYTPDSNLAVPQGTGNREATFQLINGVTLKGSYAGFGQPNPNARDIVKYKTILSGDLDGNDIDVNDPCDLCNEPSRAENIYNIVTGSGTDSTAILSGFVITGGNADGVYQNHYGGGIYNDHGSPTIAYCTITYNHAHGQDDGGEEGLGGNGGGIYCGRESSPRIENNNIVGNSADNSGSGIHCDSNSLPTIENNNIEGNWADNNGGGICCDESSPTITSNRLTKNRSGDGGAIHCRAQSSPTITNNTITENAATGEGGGIACHRYSAPAIKNNTISNNTAHVGGAICCRESSPAITNNIITKNIADLGGGIRCDRAGPIVSNNIIINNMAMLNGGGIHFVRSFPMITHNEIIDNTAMEDGGAVNSAEDSSPTIINNTLVDNTAGDDGGGIHCHNCVANISLNTITGNTADDNGGGVCCRYCSLTFINNVVTGNRAEDGAGLSCRESPLVFANNTISSNIAADIGGGIRCQGASSAKIRNNILWDNAAVRGAEIAVTDGQKLAVAYCDVAGGKAKICVSLTSILVWDHNNIDADPCFAKPGYWDPNGTPQDLNDDFWVNGDYHLKSQAGRWDPNSQSWVKDNVTSPCIDAGDPNSDWTRELWPNGNRINIGAYGGTPEASMSVSMIGNIADLNNDGVINLQDFAEIRDKWLTEEVLLTEDLDRSGIVDLGDLEFMAFYWLEDSNP